MRLFSVVLFWVSSGLSALTLVTTMDPADPMLACGVQPLARALRDAGLGEVTLRFSRQEQLSSRAALQQVLEDEAQLAFVWSGDDAGYFLAWDAWNIPFSVHASTIGWQPPASVLATLHPGFHYLGTSLSDDLWFATSDASTSLAHALEWHQGLATAADGFWLQQLGVTTTVRPTRAWSDIDGYSQGDAPQLWWGRIHDLVADQTVATRIQSIWSVPGAHRRLGHWLAQRTWWSRLDAAQQQALVNAWGAEQQAALQACLQQQSQQLLQQAGAQSRWQQQQASPDDVAMWQRAIRMQLPQWRAWFKQNMGLVVPIALDS